MSAHVILNLLNELRKNSKMLLYFARPCQVSYCFSQLVLISSIMHDHIMQ